MQKKGFNNGFDFIVINQGCNIDEVLFGFMFKFAKNLQVQVLVLHLQLFKFKFSKKDRVLEFEFTALVKIKTIKPKENTLIKRSQDRH